MRPDRCFAGLSVRFVLLAACAALTGGCGGSGETTAEGAAPPGGGGAVEVEIEAVDGGFRLLRGGAPYEVRGAGIDSRDLASLAAHGGNSFRTWTTDADAAAGRALLDDAERLGLTAVLCIAIGRERQGFDYDDTRAVADQLELARGEVLKYKDHPALLAWMIGNEPNLGFSNPRVFDAINDIARMIHDVDGRHPATTALAGFSAELAGMLETRAPDLDFVSIQLYGGIVILPGLIESTGFSRPYMVTEWGTVGHWEVETTAWGAPVELTSSEKADHYLRSWNDVLRPLSGQMIGSYVFLWGQKQERTPTWYGMFLPDGSETEAVDVVHRAWNGAWPANRSPRIERLMLDSRTARENVTLAPATEYAADVVAADPDEDRLHYRWEVMRESTATSEGGDPEAVPEALGGRVAGGDASRVTLTAPAPGAYRLFVYVHDGKGHAGHANVPFLVE